MAKSGPSSFSRTYVLLDDSIDAPVLSDGAANYIQAGGNLISEKRSGTSKFYHEDSLGTTRAITNTSGTVTDSLDTDGFGMTVVGTGSTPTPFGFAGKHGYQSDSETGLMRLGHRYYDNSTGRFISRDPIHDGYNWYIYCANDPIDCVDPQGTVLLIVAVAIGFLWVMDRAARPAGPEPPGFDQGDRPSDHFYPTGPVGGIIAVLDNPLEGGGGPPIRRGGPRAGRYHGPKPKYHNPGHHDPTQPGKFRGGGDHTTHLPSDAESVFKTAIPDNQGRNWYGRGADGDIYRYGPSGGAGNYSHWNGRENSSMGLVVPPEVIRRLGPTR